MKKNPNLLIKILSPVTALFSYALLLKHPVHTLRRILSTHLNCSICGHLNRESIFASRS